MSKTLKGIPVSSGIGIGRAFLLDRRKIKVERYPINAEEVPKEIERFHNALDLAKKQLIDIKDNLVRELGDKGHAHIVDVHILILEDEMLVNEAIKIVEQERVNAEWALRTVLSQFVNIFEGIEDSYLKERRSDIEHVGERILRNLVGKTISNINELDQDVIVIAHEMNLLLTNLAKYGKIGTFVTRNLISGARSAPSPIYAASAPVALSVIVQFILTPERSIFPPIL